jgi:hypothetical protein
MRVPPRTEIESLLSRQIEEAATCKPVEGEGRYGTERGERKHGGEGYERSNGPYIIDPTETLPTKLPLFIVLQYKHRT